MRRIISFLSAVFILFLPLNAQETSTPVGNERAYTLKSNTNIVLVPVIVRDGSGNHVSGLSKGDFTVLENGKPQQVDVFEETKSGEKIAAPVQSAMERSNATSTDSDAKRLTIIVLDLVNTPYLDQGSAKNQILKYLSQSLDSREPTSLISLRSNGIQVLSEFNTDPRVLIAALKGAASETPELRRGTREMSEGATREMTNILATQGMTNSDPSLPAVQQAMAVFDKLQGFENTPEKEIAGYKLRDAMTLTLHAFEQIAKAYAGIPGRKSLLWATGGFPFLIATNGEVQSPAVFVQGGTYGGGRADRSGNLGTLPESTSVMSSDVISQLAPVYRRAIASLNDAEIALYPIDARGLITFSEGADVHRADQVAQRELRQEHADSHATMTVMAEMTGGRAYYNANDIARSFKEAANDDLVYYTLGYYRKDDGKKQKPGWQKLQVKVNKPGLQVRARDGFMLTADRPESKEAKQADFGEAIQSPLEFSSVAMTVRLSKPSGPDPATKKRNVAFEVDMPKGAALLQDGKYDLDIFAIVNNTKGERAGQVGQVLAGTVPAAAIPQVQKDGLNYRNLVQLLPGEYSLRFIVRDNQKGRIGSVILPLKITE